MKFIDKVKVLFARFVYLGTEFANDVETVFNGYVATADEAKEMLINSGKINDIEKILSSIKGNNRFDGKCINVMKSDEYTRYDDGKENITVYFLNGQKDDFFSDEQVRSIFNIIDEVYKNGKISDVLCIRNQNEYQFYFLLNEGKNGYGDFVDDDMSNAMKVLNVIKEKGASWRTVTDLFVDIPDDVSTWAITFTI